MHGLALRAAREAGITNVLLSISHGHDTVIAVAVSQRTAATPLVGSIPLQEPQNVMMKDMNEYVEEIVIVDD